MTTDNPTQSEKLEPPNRVWLTRKEIGGHQTWVQASGHDDGEYGYARVSRTYFCACGGACTADEYIKHYFELGHDQGDPAFTSSPGDECPECGAHIVALSGFECAARCGWIGSATAPAAATPTPVEQERETQ